MPHLAQLPRRCGANCQCQRFAPPPSPFRVHPPCLSACLLFSFSQYPLSRIKRVPIVPSSPPLPVLLVGVRLQQQATTRGFAQQLFTLRSGRNSGRRGWSRCNTWRTSIDLERPHHPKGCCWTREGGGDDDHENHMTEIEFAMTELFCYLLFVSLLFTPFSSNKLCFCLHTCVLSLT